MHIKLILRADYPTHSRQLFSHFHSVNYFKTQLPPFLLPHVDNHLKADTR